MIRDGSSGRAMSSATRTLVIRKAASCRYNDEPGGRAIMNANASKLPIYLLNGVYYLMTAPRSVRKLQKKLLALVA
jgi:hypothetical protein